MARSTQTDSPKIRSISYNVGRPLSDIRYRQGPQSYLKFDLGNEFSRRLASGGGENIEQSTPRKYPSEKS